MKLDRSSAAVLPEYEVEIFGSSIILTKELDF